MNKSGPKGRPQRSSRRSPIRRNLLVFVEGVKTESAYVKVWHRLFRDEVNFEIAPQHGVPLTLLRHAMAAKADERHEARRQRGLPHDEIWCVFDEDAHPDLPQAFELARTHDIKLAISSPCIELWSILHFEEQQAHISVHDARSRSRHLLQCNKTLTVHALSHLTDVELYCHARQLAQRLEEQHLGNSSKPHQNRSSSLWKLIDSIRGDLTSSPE